jgi:phosphoglycerol transferase
MIAPSSSRRKSVAAYAATALLSSVLLIWALQLWRADLRVPLIYFGETKFNELLIKGILDFGWHVHNPAMAAPGALDLRDVPMSDNNLHFALIKLIGFFTKDSGLVLYLFSLQTYPLVALAALCALRRLGVGYAPAIFASVLYSLLPFHFQRGEPHLFLSAYFLVPLAVLVVLWIATGALSWTDKAGRLRLKWREPKLIAALVICLLIAMGGTYYAFFTCFFLLVAGCATAVQGRSVKRLLLPTALVALIFGVLTLTLLPSILYLRQHGSTPIVERHSVDAEIYSLRLATLLLPVSGHRATLMMKLKAAYNQRLSINENDDATLGSVGVLGFLGLLGWLLVRKPDARHWAEDGTGGLVSHLSILNLAAFLLATFGGIGALVALVITAKIRAYNRVSVFIAFFSLMAVALGLDWLARNYARSNTRRNVFYGALAALLVLGFLDQAAPRFVPSYSANKIEYDSDAKFMHQIEAALPQGAMVFQLPFVSFPEAPRAGRMFDYDHARGYLLTHGLRWSYGAMKSRQDEAWQRLLTSKPAPEMVESVALAGFQGIYLNRNGYNDAKVEGEITTMLGPPQFTSDDGKLIFYDLRSFAAQLPAKYGDQFEARREEVLHPLLLVWGFGFSELEGVGETSLRWGAQDSDLLIVNDSPRPRQIKIETAFATQNDATLRINGSLLNTELKTGKEPVPFSQSLTIPPGKHGLHFHSDAQRVLAPGDFRNLVFKVINFRLTVEN